MQRPAATAGAGAFDPRLPATMLVRVLGDDDAASPDLAPTLRLLEQAQELAARAWPALLRTGDPSLRLDLAGSASDAGADPRAAFAAAATGCDVLVAKGDDLARSHHRAKRDYLGHVRHPPARRALEGIPLIRIPTEDPQAPHLIAGAVDDLGLVDADLDDPGRPLTAEAVATAVFAPPRASGEVAKLRDFLAEGSPRSTWRFEYGLLMRTLHRPARRPQAPAAAASAPPAAPHPASDAGLEAIRAIHDHVDAHARYYGEKWRSTVVTRSFLLFVPNILSGAVGILAPDYSIVTAPIQVLIMAAFFWDARQSSLGRWEEKWLEYRALAERLRCLRLLRLAGVTGFFSVAAASGSWIDWYMARLEHSLARGAAPTDRTAPAIIDHLLDVEIGGQIAYHRTAVRRFTAMDIRLRRASRAILVAAIGLGSLMFGIGLFRGGVSTIPWPELSSLALILAPAIVQGLSAFRGEFDLVRLAERSARTLSGLLRLARAVRRRAPSAALAQLAARRAAEILEEEVSRWRATLESRSARLSRH